MITLVVQYRALASNFIRMAQAARDLGLPIIDVSLEFPPEVLPPLDGYPFIYGSVGFLRWAMKRPELSSYIAWNESNLSPVTWKAQLGEIFLNHDGHKCMAEDAPSGWHVRPIRNDKTFSGQIEPIPEEYAKVPSWASPPKELFAEIRVFCIGGQYVTSSMYTKKTYVPPLRPPVLNWLPFQDCVIDFGWSNRGWRVIEFNSIHTSGLYKCSEHDILKAFIKREENYKYWLNHRIGYDPGNTTLFGY